MANWCLLAHKVHAGLGLAQHLGTYYRVHAADVLALLCMSHPTAPLNLSSPGPSLPCPPASDSYRTQPFWPHGVWFFSSLGPLVLSLLSPPPPPFLWPGSVWSLPDASGCCLLHTYNKIFLNCTLKRPYPHFHSRWISTLGVKAVCSKSVCI